MDPLEVLARSELFAGASRADLEPLARSAQLRDFGRGEALWNAGDPADKLYLVLSGEITVSRIGPDGEEYVIEVFVGGDVMGQLHMFEATPTRLLDARATLPSSCWLVPRRDFLGLLEGNPRLTAQILRTYSRWILQRDLQAADGAFRNLTARVATRFLHLAEQYGEPSPLGTRIGLRLTAAALANMLGASRENVSRAIAQLHRTEDIRREGGYYVLPRPARTRERYSWVSEAEARLVGR